LVTPGTGKTIVWSAGSDWPEGYATQMWFRITADDGFAMIPGGSFTMGAVGGEFWVTQTAPSITVAVSPFYMRQTETTKAEWDKVRLWAAGNGYTDLAEGGGKASNHPVQTLNWLDVVKWCNARSEMEGLEPVYSVSGAVMRTGLKVPEPNWSANGYRLPTEAEWEKAARGGVSGKRFPWGTDTISHAQANYRGNPFFPYDQSPVGFHPSYMVGGPPYTAPVGSFEANGYGLYDMAGNISEWCWDWLVSSYYTTSNGTTDPRGPAYGAAQIIPRVGTINQARPLRGGDWMGGTGIGNCSYRGGSQAWFARKDFGFRQARSSDTPLPADSQGHVSTATSQSGSFIIDTRDAPTVTKPTATKITAIGATVSGCVISDGGNAITERGVVYSASATNDDPIIGGVGVMKVAATGTTGILTAALTGLSKVTSYSYRVYAINNRGATYTGVGTFTTPLNELLSAAPSSTFITSSSARLGREIIPLVVEGRLVERGVVYSVADLNTEPQVGGVGVTKLPDNPHPGSTYDDFQRRISNTIAAYGLSSATRFAHRAYATTTVGTSYSEVGYFTTETPVTFTAGIGTANNLYIHSGESRLFAFDLAQSSLTIFNTTGASPAMQWELRDALNALVASGTGNVDFTRGLALGGYRMRITNPGSSTETFSLNLDASAPASPRPDISVGLDQTASSGADLYDPPAPQQSVLAISTKAANMNVFFLIDNDGNLPDAMRISGPGPDSRFRVAYTLAGRNITGGVIAGTATTAVLAAADAPVPLVVRISPNRKNADILRRVVVNLRPTSVYGRETFGPKQLTVRATTDPTLSDTATFQLNTVP
jgi:formylglycine-generating enzyme required for sulfatase activity